MFSGILAAAGRAQIKGLLRDQRTIAGIGNAYSDEILHAARMSPFTPANMSAENVHLLYTAIRETLAAAVARVEGVAASGLKGEKKSNLRVHGRAGRLLLRRVPLRAASCWSRRAPLRRAVQGGRGILWRCARNNKYLRGRPPCPG